MREFDNRPLRGWRCAALVVAALVILVIDRKGRDLGIITSQPVYWTLALIAYSMVSVSFVATLVFDRGIVKRVMTMILSLSLFRGLGHLSYAMYVFHLPVLFYLGLNDAATHGTKMPILQVALAFGITLGLSILSYYLLENPVAKLKQNFSGTRPVEPVSTKGVNVTQGRLPAGFARAAFLSSEDGARPADESPQLTTIWPGVRRSQAK
ncbi:acyltransferase [Bradyrhizobium sp. NFR13]|uniref:acyltransferase family protein n=1 Tax=Bradyrhizobium sp. NFR13 TaxID=1566285 RepID=UPI00111345E8|nr:acyltransferase [Bradyrhizobium sp. NFR13]